MKEALATLRAHEACTGKAGSVGYCLGGKLAFLMATRTDSDCNVGYYGVGLGDLLGEARQIEKPLTLHIAEKDRFSSPEEITKVREALESTGKATTHLHKGQDHAYARPGGEHSDAATRTEEARVEKACASKSTSRWSPVLEKKKNTQ